MPHLSAAVSAHDSEWRCFLCRGPHRAVCYQMGINTTEKGRREMRQASTVMALTKALALWSNVLGIFTIAARPKSIFLIGHGIDCGVRSSGEEYDPFDVYAPSEENHVLLDHL